MRARPISPGLVVEELCERIAAASPGRWLRVAVDGAPPAGPGRLADSLVERVRARGRAVLRVSARDFLRPASLRYEFGRYDPDVFYDEWLDENGLVREVLGPLEPGGTGKVLPSLWDSVRDRATRARYVTLPAGGVLLLDGSLLLGRGLPFDLTVHLSMSPAALARRTPDDERWTLPAYTRYENEARPTARADVAIKMDDPGHPALILAAD
ncbi:uridine kinase [Actinomadura sp. NBRC 104412]|uniref:uridine kinase n=1 Tax=Actinomadura sp. NBRC 104412 TaxID=3032203 RepID=UPI0024A481BB|nr:uridine kinase [Actinomadura sp. NBRC 104412]GLZ05616.1 uridine kinase [Actinomadura sp. NBRC 104412]